MYFFHPLPSLLSEPFCCQHYRWHLRLLPLRNDREEEEDLEEEDTVENEEEKKTVTFLGPIPLSFWEPTVSVTIIFNGCSTPCADN